LKINVVFPFKEGRGMAGLPLLVRGRGEMLEHVSGLLHMDKSSADY
jgi:hypothetical protein